MERGKIGNLEEEFGCKSRKALKRGWGAGGSRPRREGGGRDSGMREETDWKSVAGES